MRPKPDLMGSGGANPGPGTYDTTGKGTKGPKYTMRLKPDSQYNSIGPGPGAYEDSKAPISQKHPSWKIGTEQRGREGYDNSNPGPGQYEDKRALSSKGTRFPKDPRGKSLGSNTNPGPGNYMTQSDIDDGLKNKKGKTFGLKTSLHNNDSNPAPGYYEQDVGTIRPAAAKYKFGTATRNSDNKNFNPSPVDYQAKDTYVKQSAPKWGMGTGVQRGDAFSSTKNNPGPGTYEPGLYNDSKGSLLRTEIHFRAEDKH